MNNGKQIELFLVESDPNGIITAEISNWTGKAIKIPREKFQVWKHEDLSNPGAYFLFYDDNRVYIGEAENIEKRLKDHASPNNPEKETQPWVSALCFINQYKYKRDLNKELLTYIKHELVKLVKENNTFTLLTKNTYTNTVLKDSAIAPMNEFIYNIKILVKLLGYSVLDKNTEDSTKIKELPEEIFYLRSRGANAMGKPSKNGFVVLKGSLISDTTTISFAKRGNSLKRRNELINDAAIVNGIFQINYEFSSPSTASTIIIGSPSNGLDDWKNEKGISLGDIKGSVQIKEKQEEIFYLTNKNSHARGYLTQNNGFVVLKGSLISDTTAPLFKARNEQIARLRDHLQADGSIINNIFQIDYEFASPSTASAFVMGYECSGWTKWKNKKGITLSDRKRSP